MTYKNWLTIWLENYVKPSSKERTYFRYGQLIRTHIAPKIGEIDVNNLTPIVLQSFVKFDEAIKISISQKNAG